jgi:hypothetical protein
LRQKGMKEGKKEKDSEKRKGTVREKDKKER